jgi:glyoxalase-like protein
MRMASAVLDHLVVAAATLEQGERYIESRLGTRPMRGGKHVAMGTHNSLLKLGSKIYLEVIAVDPDAIAPQRPRWFGLDAPGVRAALQETPRLLHWVARTDDIEAARGASRADPGEIYTMSRGAFEWRMTIPVDGELPAGGVLPTLIQWKDERHPADSMPDAGIRLIAIGGAHPEPASIRAALAALSLADAIKITFASKPRLAAMLQTPRGPVAL